MTGETDVQQRGPSQEQERRLERVFLRDDNGRRPVYGATRKFQEDPHCRDLILFYEHFHADDGAGIGASHQTGWTGLVSSLISLFGETTAKQFLEERKAGLDRLAQLHEAGGAAATTGA